MTRFWEPDGWRSVARSLIIANASGAVCLAQQAFGELMRFAGRDGISFALKQPGGPLGECGGVGGGSGQLPDFSEVQQPVALQVELVRGLDEPRRRRRWP